MAQIEGYISQIIGPVIDVHFPTDFDPTQRVVLERAATTCPVARSLHPDCKQTIRFHYGA